MKRTLRLLLGIVLPSLAACFPGGSGRTPLDSADSAAGVDTALHDDSGRQEGETSFETLGDPCNGATLHALHADAQGRLWVGCGSGMGLHVSDDGGRSFEKPISSGNLYIFDIDSDASGRLLACGHDYSRDHALLYRSNGEGWDTLLSYGDHRSDPARAYISNCGAVAAAGDGTILVASNTIGDITTSDDDGASWSLENRYWEDDNLDPGGYAAWGLMSVVSAGGLYYASGSTITDPPMFFVPSSHETARWYNLDARVVDEGVMGEAWALATPDAGETWLVGGRDQGASGQASGFIFRGAFGGASWERLILGPEIDIVHDIAFSEDGLHGVAVGHRYPPASLGGFVLLTDDGGRSWRELETDVPILQSASVVGRAFFVGGDGYLAGGTF